MARETIKEIKDQLFILDHHGLKQADIAKWIKENKLVKGFSQPAISRLRQDDKINEKHTEFLTYLDELIELLKANQLYFEIDAHLLKSDQKRIKEVVFSATSKSEKKRLFRSILFIGTFIILLVIGFRFLMPGTESVDSSLDCSIGSKTAVLVALFQQDVTGGFSKSVVTSLKGLLNEDLYKIASTEPQAFDAVNYRDTIKDEYFNHTCDTSGVFLNGQWNPDPNPRLRVFNCYIDIFDLHLETPSMSGQYSIRLDNPAGMKFSVREDSKFIANFVAGLLKTYEGEYFEALEIFQKIEKDTTLLQDDRLKAFIAFYKANNLGMIGDHARAKVAYQRAAKLESKLRDIAFKNIDTVKEIAKRMDDNPELKNTLKSNIAQDSIFEKPDMRSTNLDGVLEERSDRKVTLEKVAKSMNRLEPSHENEQDQDTALTGDEVISDSQEPQLIPEQNNGEEAISKAGEDSIAGKEELRMPGSPKSRIIEIDGIKAVEIAEKIWMRENLNVDVGKGSRFYNNDPANGKKYGRLYTWEAAKRACFALGNGWRLPTDDEWDSLINEFGGVEKAYKALIDGSHTGFDAVLGGSVSARDTTFSSYYGDLGQRGYYWSSTEADADNAWRYYFSSGKLFRGAIAYKFMQFSCRCLKGS